MIRGLRYALPMLLVTALLAIGTSVLIQTLSHGWFVRDVAARARLAVRGAREPLARHFRRADASGMRALLADLARDERILAAAACDRQSKPLATTDGYPAGFPCASLAREEIASAPAGWAEAEFVAKLDGGRVHVAALPVSDRGELLGFVALVHDLSFIDRRESMVLRGSLTVLALLGLAAFLATLSAARFSIRRWTHEMRDLLRRGKPAHPEFAPLLQDVRELVTRLTKEQTEAALEAGSQGWSPARLRQVLRRHLHGEKVIVVANREPYMHERNPDGSIRVLHPASGLVTALEPVMRACSGVWVAHGSGSADRETADAHGRIRVPPGEESYAIRRVWLSKEQEEGYYNGFANEGLWPLCHVAHTRPTFRASDWRHYQDVNRVFADAVVAEADVEDPIVFVQDYHFALAPKMIRERLPKATVITFWHIPWPNAERVGICPWHEELLEGLLGSSIVGFHTRFHCNNFIESVDRFLEARIDRERQAVVSGRRPTLVRPYPISIEWPSRWADSTPPAEQCRKEVFAELGLRPDALLGVGVDRVDYTKGIEERLLAVERLLERRPDLIGRFTFAQLGAPSRTAIPRYRDLNVLVEELAARINARFGRDGYRPIALLRKHHEPPDVFRAYRAANLCYVSSLHDGMNLVAKEFVAARDDERGVLVLSTFTGAARELTEALIVNPYDIEEASHALEVALEMPESEQAERLRPMRSLVAELNVYRWAGRMLTDAAEHRERERLADRLVAWPATRATA